MFSVRCRIVVSVFILPKLRSGDGGATVKYYRRVCPYNAGVICSEQVIAKCKACGWNPKEMRRRKAYDPPPEIDEAKAKQFLEKIEIDRWRERTYGKSEQGPDEHPKY